MNDLPINPYRERGMVLDPEERFFGRKRELREVFSRLATMQSVSVIGQRRIGKSSFLNRIAHAENGAMRGAAAFYLDLQRVFSTEEFYERACKLLRREGQSHIELEEAIQDKRVIFCLDEFEQAYSQDFGSEFFNALRSLAQSGNLALVVATQTPLNELHAQFLQDEDVTSKFHNIFTPLKLGEFTNEEAQEMITTPRNGHRFSDEEARAILELGGTHPYKLNLACSIFFDAKQDRLLTDGKVSDAVLEQLRERFDAELNASITIPSSGNNASAQRSYVASQTRKPATATAATITGSTTAGGQTIAQSARAERAIHISGALLLIAGVFMFFATQYPNPISIFLSAAMLCGSLGFLIATRVMWPKETRRGE